ncbi:MAG: oxidoreductase [Gammaproteobacteria bacterium]|nr:oxidoreductase [Gammaproteobacteria bacterium]HAN80812.1 oxidoreductase [Gammaproteobacteria bacterium]
MNVSFLGLGVMGYPMAGHLARAGHKVTVYNRSGAKAEKWTNEFGGVLAATPKEAATGKEIVFACVGNDDDLRSITLGETGAFAGMNEGSLFVDHTTASADVARELFGTAKALNVGFMDAPVSGGQQGAENGALTVMVGGSQAHFDRASPVIDVYARACTLMGEVGTGQLTKMVNQICIAGLVEALSEGLSFARASGLDAHQVIDVISKGAAQSWQMENRYETMLADKFEHGFAVDWMRKDLSICLAEARKNGSALPVTAAVDQLYGEVQSMGGGRWDTSSLFARLEAMRKRGGS